MLENASASLASGIGGVKIKVGQPDSAEDLRRVRAVREHLGDDVPLMVDANQQWDRPTAMRVGRRLEEFGLVWLEEPLDAYDAEGHAQLAQSLDTAIATGEMLTSVAELAEFIRLGAVDILQPDAPRVGGITPFLKLAALAEHRNLQIAPHFAMGSTCTWPRPIRTRPGWSTSTGSTPCSTSAWRSAADACTCPTGPASDSR